MTNNSKREAMAEFLEGRRQMKNAWDVFHRQSYRRTFILGRLALHHLIAAMMVLDGRRDDDDMLGRFWDTAGRLVPLDKAETMERVLHPAELKQLSPIRTKPLSESIDDWLITRSISRARAFEYVSQAQESVNTVITLIGEYSPDFLKEALR